MEREGGGPVAAFLGGLSDTLTLHFQVGRPLPAPLWLYNTCHKILTQPLQVFLSDNVSTLKRALILGDYNVNPTSRHSRKRYGSKLFIGGFYSNKMTVFSPVQYLNLNIPLDFPGPFPVYKDKVPACREGKGDGLHQKGQHK